MKANTAEEWLKTAVEMLDKHVFDGDLNTATHKFQIYYGHVRGKRGSESVIPSDCEDINLDDFFPITIGIDYKLRDEYEMLKILASECIKAFLGVTKGKRFKKTCEMYGFEAPFSEPNPSLFLRDCLQDALKDIHDRCGEFPWSPVKFPVKEPKEKKPTKAVFFCPECGMEYSVSIKQLKDNQGTPTCICGAKTGREQEDDLTEETENPAG